MSFLFFLRFQIIGISHAGGESDHHSHDGHKQICAVPDYLIKNKIHS